MCWCVVQLLASAVEWVSAERPQSSQSVMMVVGVPNAGKSSVINALKLAANARGAYVCVGVIRL